VTRDGSAPGPSPPPISSHGHATLHRRFCVGAALHQRDEADELPFLTDCQGLAELAAVSRLLRDIDVQVQVNQNLNLITLFP
jgi:hypothetical protein